MKILRVTVTILFVIVSVVFVGFYISEKVNNDTTVPTINIETNLLEVSFDVTEKELLQGVTAMDGKDGDLTDEIIIQSVSNFIDDGMCKVTYAVCDSNNNVTTATRKICYVNYKSPEFSMVKSTCFSIYDNINISDVFRAYDCIDGDISRNIIATSKDFTGSVAGVFQLEVTVTNSKGDTSTVNIPLIVEDRSITAPTIKLNEYLIYANIEEEIDFSKYLIDATDSAGADITSAVRIEENVDFSKAGTYSVHYYVTDSRGNRGHTILNVIVG